MSDAPDSGASEAKRLATAGDGAAAASSVSLPAWFPRWAGTLAELYFSGTTSSFLLHGNVFDLIRAEDDGKPVFLGLEDFVAEQLFGRWDLVLHYDLSRGLRVLPGRSEARLRAMLATATKRVGDLASLPKELATNLALLDRFVMKNLVAKPEERLSAAIIMSHASFVAPRADRADERAARQLVTLLNWATSPYVKRMNMAFVLIEPDRAQVADRYAENPHVAAIEVPLPDAGARADYLGELAQGRDVASFSEFTLPQIADLTAGISLTDLSVLVRSSIEARRKLDRRRFQDLKKRLIERQAQGLLEFVEPRWDLDMVVGHEAAKRRLREDADLLAKGRLASVPMGYLFCGPVGTGKTFLAQCVAGSLGVPAVTLKNFRSKYVGETEANLQRVLSVLRGMGPVVVIVDEADAMLGDREGGGGDSGISGRVFGMIAEQMGDTRYRGKIVWMLLTARPDLLPIDLKRQGRAEVHIPLFYPTDEAELRAMFVIMAKKLGTALAPEDVGEIPHKGELSGADIEGIVGRAWRASLLAGEDHITKEALAASLAGFLPMTQSLERELQRLAAVIECTDREFLPVELAAEVDAMGGRAKLQQRVTAIKQALEAM
ncbi:MAG: ATP-binding protein [Myxococcales bacterium]|nr:ATP-binding protein [Myxococcales bacterium]MCB9733163.1 ATP-binding protein [Deltaproteobacteria bacterium]